MSRVIPVSFRARSGAIRLALSSCAAALIAAAAVAPTFASTIVNTTGHIGAISVVDSSSNPGVTCKFVLPLVSLNRQPALSKIIVSGPRVGPIVSSATGNAIAPALVSADFRVYQRLTVNGEPAGSRLVLSAVHQVLATSLSGTKVPDHTFDAHNLPSGRYTAQIVVTYKSTDQTITYGSRVIRYDFYKSIVSEYSLALGHYIDVVKGVGTAC
jgi:hypothetical protein